MLREDLLKCLASALYFGKINFHVSVALIPL